MNAPLFTGQRVRLSVIQSDDEIKRYVNWSRDAEFLRLLDDDPAMPWSAERMKEELAREPKWDDGFFLVRALDDDRPIGFVVIFDPHGTHGNATLAIAIGEKALWGQGYGTDAIRVILRYAFLELNLHRVSLFVLAHNARAIGSYVKCGFRVEGRVRQAMLRDGERSDFIYMGVLKDDWLSAIRSQ